MDSKPIWESKTFWLNVGGVFVAWALNHYDVLGIPMEYQAVALAGLNLANRFLTSGRVTLT